MVTINSTKINTLIIIKWCCFENNLNKLYDTHSTYIYRYGYFIWISIVSNVIMHEYVFCNPTSDDFMQIPNRTAKCFSNRMAWFQWQKSMLLGLNKNIEILFDCFI